MTAPDILFAATFVSTLLLAAVLGYLNRRAPAAYLRHWTVYWALSALALAGLLAAPPAAARTVGVLSHLLGLLAAVYLFRGARALQGRELPRAWWAAFALVAAWVVAAGVHPRGFLVDSLPPYLFRGGLLVWAGVLLVRLPSAVGPERFIPGIAFIIDGVHLADYPFLGQNEAVLPWALLLSLSNRFLIGVGMLLLHFRQAHLEARRSERNFRSTFELSPVATALTGMESGRVIDANRAYSEVVGYDRAEVLGRRPADFGLWVDPRQRDELLTAVRRDGVVREFPARLRHRDGSVREMALSAARIAAPEEDRLLVMGRDVTAEVEARARLGRLAGILEATPDAVGVWDRRGRGIYLNGTARRLLGVPDDAPPGEARIQGLVEPGLFAGALRRALKHGSWSGETSLPDGRGGTMAASVVVVAHRDAEGRVDHVATLVRDITEMKDLQAQFLQSQKLEALGQLAGGVAHDFNNLLTVIGGYAEALEEEALTREHQGLAREIRLAQERAAGLTRQLLAFARRDRPSPRVLQLDEAVGAMRNLLGRLIGEDIHLRVSLASATRVRMDPAHLDQAVVNLVVNARDAVGSGGTITLATDEVGVEEVGAVGAGGRPIPPGRYARIRVADDGHGMDEATLRRVFEPFFTTKAPGQGSGLGLSTVYGVVEGAGGFLRAQSEAGVGTTFEILLPVEGEEEEAQAVPADGDAGRQPDEGRTALVVEDDVAVRALTVRHLRALGYRIAEATDGLHGARVLEGSAGFDVLVTDVVMPEMGGGHLATFFRERCPQGRVVLMSGYTDRRIPDGLLDEAGVAFLQKPFRRADLARAIAEAGG